jgi:uncharacterized protein with PIN domain
MFAVKRRELFKEVQLSVPFRSICYHCRRPLDFTDRKYVKLDIEFGYYCEECKGHLWKHNS